MKSIFSLKKMISFCHFASFYFFGVCRYSFCFVSITYNVATIQCSTKCCKNSQLNERKTKSNKVTNHKGWSQFTQFLHTKHFLQLCCFLNLCKGRITCLLLKITFAELVPTSFGTRRSTLCHIFRATPQCPQLFPNAPQHPTAIQTACTCATRFAQLVA